MKSEDKTLTQFIGSLESSEPTPGGGGGAAMAGAVGIALGTMVGAISENKKKYEDRKEYIEELISRGKKLSIAFLSSIDDDATNFLELMDVYKKRACSEEEREERRLMIEEKTRKAAIVPERIFDLCCEAIDLHGEFLGLNNSMLLSDIGSGVTILSGSLRAAYLNIMVNISGFNDDDTVEKKNQFKDKMELYLKKADKIYKEVEECYN